MEQMPPVTPAVESKPGPAGWLPVWIKAVTRPSEQTYIELAEHPDASSRTAYIWVFLAGTLSGIVQAFASTIRVATGAAPMLQQIPGLDQYLPPEVLNSGAAGGAGIMSLIGGICAAPFAGLLSVVFFALGIAIIQWIAKLFGGAGSYEKLVYVMAAITVPFTLVSAVSVLLSVIPFVGLCMSVISFALAIYALVLQVMAVKAVNGFGWGPAAGAVFIPGCVMFFFCMCLVIGGMMLLVPVLSDSFGALNGFAP